MVAAAVGVVVAPVLDTWRAVKQVMVVVTNPRLDRDRAGDGQERHGDESSATCPAAVGDDLHRLTSGSGRGYLAS